MPLNLGNLLVTDVWSVFGFDVNTGKPLFSLVNCNNTEFVHSSDSVEITGGKGGKTIAVLTSNNKAVLNVESSTFDLNLMSLQAGDKDGIYTQSAIVPYSQKITISDLSKASLAYTPAADEFVSVMLDNGVALIESTAEIPAVSITEFTVTAKELTFDASYKNLTGTAFYSVSVADAAEILIDSASQIQYATIKAEATFQNQCDGLNYLGYIIIPKAGIDKNFTISANKSPSDGGSVHNAIFKSAATCSETNLAKIVIYDANSLTV